MSMSTQNVKPDPSVLERQHKRHHRWRGGKRIGAVAAAAAALLLIPALVGCQGGDEAPATDETRVVPEGSENTMNARAEEVATGFLEAFGAFDVGQAKTYLADDATIASLGAQDDLGLLISWLEGTEYRQILDSCEELGNPGSGSIRCTFDFHALRSGEIGRGPFGGSSFDLVVRDGKIVQASQNWEIEKFSPQVWEPFASWVSTAHPEDAAVMYQDESYTNARLTEESIRLWKRHTRAYVEEVGRRTGKYALTEEGVPFSFRVPTTGGWERFSSISTDKSAGGPISINKSIVGPQGAEAIVFWTSFPDGDYADPCARVLNPPVGSSAADLAAAVSTAPGTELVSGPSNVTVGGRPAKHVVLTVREDVGCDPGFFYTWRDVDGGALWPTTGVGNTIRVWIVAVDGTRLFIEAATTEQADSDLEQEIQQIVESIRFN